jgi:sulfate permease, SulP family
MAAPKPESKIGRSVFFPSVAAGLNATLVTLPGTIFFGALAYSHLGDAWVARGIFAYLLAHAVFGGIAALMGPTKNLVFGPRSFSAIAYANVVFAVLAHYGDDLSPESVATIAVISMLLTGFLSGLWQMLIGGLGWGSVVKSIPYPIISSLLNATALVMLLAQVNPLLGISREADISLLQNPVEYIQSVKILAPVIGVVTIVLMFKLRGQIFRIPSSLIALAVGVGLYWGFSATGFDAQLGTTLPNTISWDGVFGALTAVDTSDVTPKLMRISLDILTSSLLLATLNCISAITASNIVSDKLLTPININSVFFRHGWMNALASLIGTAPGTAKSGATKANIAEGSDGRIASLTTAAGYFAILGFIPLLQFIPREVLAALAVVISYSLFDSYGRALFTNVVRGQWSHVKSNLGTYLTVLVVISLYVFKKDMILALGVGLFAALLDFAYKMSAIKIRVRNLSDVRSRVQRDLNELDILGSQASKVILIDIQCFILFTIAERIALNIKNNVSPSASIILNFREVNYIDQTGVEELGRLFKMLRATDNTVYATGFRKELQNTDWLNLRQRIGEEFILANVDSALEVCENKLILKSRSESVAEHVSLTTDLMRDVDDDALEIIRRYSFERHFNTGDELTAQGDQSSELFCIISGSVDVMHSLIDDSGLNTEHRLFGYRSGTILGELAFFDQNIRSASLIAREQTTCIVIDRESFAKIQADDPHLGNRLLINIGRVTSERLRLANNLQGSPHNY